MAKLYEAQEKQYLFHTSKADETLYGGAAGGGKSFSIIWDALSFGLSYDKVRISIFRRTYPELEKSIVEDWLKYIPSKYYDYNKKEHKATLKNGSFIEFNHCELEEDVYRFQCFHPETEVLTKEGFKNVSKVRQGELVATINPKTKEINYQPTVKTFAYDFNGELITGEKSIRFAVTPNHKMLVGSEKNHNLRFVEAESLYAESRFQLSGKWTGKEAKDFVFQSDGNNGREIRFTPKQFMRFMGWYLSEGSLDHKTYRIRLSQQKESGKTEIRLLLKEIGLNFWEKEKEFAFCNKALYQYLKLLGTSNYKYIDPKLKNLSKDLLEELLDSIIAGDGVWRDRGRLGSFVSSSKKLCDDVGEIALKCGFGLYFRTQPKNPINSVFGQKDRYRVDILRRDNLKRTRAFGRQKYQGKVYSIEVKPHHTIFTRYKGSCIWIGQSAQYDRIYFDELTTFSENIYIYLHSRCRTTNPDIKPQIKSATNPTGIGFLWVKKRFVDAGPANQILEQIDPETKNKFTSIYIPAKVYDNKYIMKADPKYIERLMKLPEEQRKALLNGSWEHSEGQYFKEWNSSVHVIEPFKIPEFWTRALGMDWGYSTPTVILWVAFAPKNDPVHKGTAYVYRELVKTKCTDTEIARLFHEYNGNDKIDYIAADPKLWSVTQYERGESIAQRLLEMKLPIIKADNNRISGWSVVRSYLEFNQIQEPKIYFFHTCNYTIRTIPSLIYDRIRPEDLESKGTEDHAADSLRYILMTKPIASKIPRKKTPYNSFQYWFNKIKSSKHKNLYVGSI
jgi:hypothetical protein